MLGTDELKKRFYPQFLTPAGLVQIEYVRERFLDLATSLDSILPDGREKSLAVTELQGASMWAIKAVCCDKAYWRKDSDPPVQADAVKGVKKIVGFKFNADAWELIYSDGTSGGTIRPGLLEELVETHQQSKDD